MAKRSPDAVDAMTSSNEELVRRLASFGLPESEAELYFHLARLQQAKAAELAHASGRRRPDVYPLLDHLADRGLVQRTTDRPAVYIPVDIATALSRLVERDRVRLDQLRAEAEELQKEWPAVRQDLPAREDRLAVHQGLAQITAILQERLQGAQHEILAALSPALLHKLDGVPQVMAEKPPDCQVRILTMIDSASDADALGPAGTACDVRHHVLPSHFEMVLVDGKEAFVFLSAGRADSTHGTEEVVLWLQSPDAALANQGIFDGFWGQAIDLAERLAEIKGGRLLERIAVMRGRWIRCTRMREVIVRAEAEIQCFVAAEEVADWEETEIHEWLRQRADEGVRVKVHAHQAEFSGVPMVPLSKAPAGTLVVADRREAVCAFPTGPGGADHATQRQERSLWTTHPDLVQMLLDGCLHGQDLQVPV